MYLFRVKIILFEANPVEILTKLYKLLLYSLIQSYAELTIPWQKNLFSSLGLEQPFNFSHFFTTSYYNQVHEITNSWRLVFLLFFLPSSNSFVEL